jgi:protein-tyrosine phosphatase
MSSLGMEFAELFTTETQRHRAFLIVEGSMHTSLFWPRRTARRLAVAGATLLGASLLWMLVRLLRPIPLPRQLPPVRRELGRRIAFDGPGNLRDLGGYRTADGRSVRWGVLYRSDHLGRLSARDLRQLRRLELAVLVDFRSGAEKREAPNRLPRGHGIKVVELPLFDNDAQNDLGLSLRSRIASGDLSTLDAAAFLVEANQRLATEFTPAYRQFVAELLAARGAPLLFHCTAGKDRTGFAAAIVLRLLGVPEEAIVADYLRSQAYNLATYQRDLLLLRLLKGAAVTAVARALLGVDPAYLQAAFAAIDHEYGSFDAYVRCGLGLGEADIAQLRELLLDG